MKEQKAIPFPDELTHLNENLFSTGERLFQECFMTMILLAAFEGLEENRFVKHLVIDEMQDYTPIQFAVINMMYPCQKTILGDFGQVLNPCHLHSLDEIRRIYKDAEFVALNKSYLDSTSFTNGVSITSIRVAKGLEFDEVIVPDAD